MKCTMNGTKNSVLFQSQVTASAVIWLSRGHQPCTGQKGWHHPPSGASWSCQESQELMPRASPCEWELSLLRVRVPGLCPTRHCFTFPPRHGNGMSLQLWSLSHCPSPTGGCCAVRHSVQLAPPGLHCHSHLDTCLGGYVPLLIFRVQSP